MKGERNRTSVIISILTSVILNIQLMYAIKKVKATKMCWKRKLLFKKRTLLDSSLEDYAFLALIMNVLSSTKRVSNVMESCLITSVNILDTSHSSLKNLREGFMARRMRKLLRYVNHSVWLFINNRKDANDSFGKFAFSRSVTKTLRYR